MTVKCEAENMCAIIFCCFLFCFFGKMFGYKMREMWKRNTKKEEEDDEEKAYAGEMYKNIFMYIQFSQYEWMNEWTNKRMNESVLSPKTKMI